MPGFITSILKYESETLLCADISHKILRSDTVLEIMYEAFNSCKSTEYFYDEMFKKLVGSIVMTRYVLIHVCNPLLRWQT